MAGESKESRYIQFKSIPGKKGINIIEHTLPAVREKPAKNEVVKTDGNVAIDSKVAKDGMITKEAKKRKQKITKDELLIKVEEKFTKEAKTTKEAKAARGGKKMAKGIKKTKKAKVTKHEPVVKDKVAADGKTAKEIKVTKGKPVVKDKVTKDAKITKEIKATKGEIDVDIEKVAKGGKVAKERKPDKNEYIIGSEESSTDKSKTAKKYTEKKFAMVKAIQVKKSKLPDLRLHDYIMPPSKSKSEETPPINHYILPSKQDVYMLPSKQEFIVASEREPDVVKNEIHKSMKGYASKKDKSKIGPNVVPTVENKESENSDETFDKTVYETDKMSQLKSKETDKKSQLKSLEKSSLVSKNVKENQQKRVQTYYTPLLMLVGVVAIVVVILLVVIIILVLRDSPRKTDELSASKVCEDFGECFYYNSKYVDNCESFLCDYINLEPQIIEGRLEFKQQQIPEIDRKITSTNKLPCNYDGITGFCNTRGKCIKSSGAVKNEKEEAINGEWSSWSFESKCIANLSNDTNIDWSHYLRSDNYKFRQCLNPKPSNGGKLCWKLSSLQLNEWPIKCAKNCEIKNPAVSCSGTPSKLMTCFLPIDIAPDGTSRSDKKFCCDKQEGRCILGSCAPWSS